MQAEAHPNVGHIAKEPELASSSDEEKLRRLQSATFDPQDAATHALLLMQRRMRGAIQAAGEADAVALRAAGALRELRDEWRVRERGLRQQVVQLQGEVALLREHMLRAQALLRSQALESLPGIKRVAPDLATLLLPHMLADPAGQSAAPAFSAARMSAGAPRPSQTTGHLFFPRKSRGIDTSDGTGSDSLMENVKRWSTVKEQVQQGSLAPTAASAPPPEYHDPSEPFSYELGQRRWAKAMGKQQVEGVQHGRRFISNGSMHRTDHAMVAAESGQAGLLRNLDVHEDCRLLLSQCLDRLDKAVALGGYDSPLQRNLHRNYVRSVLEAACAACRDPTAHTFCLLLTQDVEWQMRNALVSNLSDAFWRQRMQQQWSGTGSALPHSEQSTARGFHSAAGSTTRRSSGFELLPPAGGTWAKRRSGGRLLPGLLQSRAVSSMN